MKWCRVFLCLRYNTRSFFSQAYDNVESSMRKASVFCIVSLHQLAGEDLQPHLESLTGSKLKLLNLYIKRAQERTQFNRKYCCFVTRIIRTFKILKIFTIFTLTLSLSAFGSNLQLRSHATFQTFFNTYCGSKSHSISSNKVVLTFYSINMKSETDIFC